MEFDMDYFADTTAWAIGGILFILFMSLIWLMPDIFGGTWEGKGFERIMISILALPVCYIVSKWKLDSA